nr:hypothetical protein [Tanacetum cinerariifolium]
GTPARRRVRWPRRRRSALGPRWGKVRRKGRARRGSGSRAWVRWPPRHQAAVGGSGRRTPRRAAVARGTLRRATSWGGETPVRLQSSGRGSRGCA